MEKTFGDRFFERFSVRWNNFLDRTPMLAMCLAVAMGVLLQQWLTLAVPIWMWLVLTSLAFSMALVYLQRVRWTGWVCLPVFVAVGGWQNATLLQRLSSDPSHLLTTDNWQPVVFECKVEAIPRWRPDVLSYRDSFQESDQQAWQTLVEVGLIRVRDRQIWKNAQGRLTLTIDHRMRNLLPGDRIRVFGKWQRIPKPSNPGQFDMRAHYQRKGQFIRARAESSQHIEHLDSKNWVRMDRGLAWFLMQGDMAIHRYVRKQQAPLASALVLGQREQVEWDMQEALLATGTMHMLAISGMHVEMVAVSIMTFCLLIHLPRKMTLLIIASIVVGYSLLCGGQPPVVRAMILVVCVCLARWLGRPTHAMNLLAFSGIVLLVQRPNNLLDLGTQLSFLAVAVLCALAGDRFSRASDELETQPTETDPLDVVIFQSRPWWQRALIRCWAVSWDLTKVSAWVWVITMPLVLSSFHIVSPVAVLLNVILWLPLLVGLLSGLGILFVGTWCPPVAWILGVLCSACLASIQAIISLAEWLPGSHVWLPAPDSWWTIGFYVILASLWMGIGFSQSTRKWYKITIAFWLAIGLVPLVLGPQGKIPCWSSSRTQPLTITWIDVGHGTSVLIETPNRSTWLYDAGRMGDPERSYQSIASVLWYERLSRLNGLFLSHADSDHYNAIDGIGKRFQPKVFATTSQVASNSSPLLREVLQGIQRQRVELQIWSAGGEQDIDGVHFSCLHPTSTETIGSDNAQSLCLLIEYAGRRILLPGDLESPGTEQLVAQPKIAVDVLMAPHHGSLSKSPASLLQWCMPEVVAISGAERAVDPRVLQAYGDSERLVLVTARDGAIRVKIEASGKMVAMRWNDGSWQEMGTSPDINSAGEVQSAPAVSDVSRW